MLLHFLLGFQDRHKRLLRDFSEDGETEYLLIWDHIRTLV